MSYQNSLFTTTIEAYNAIHINTALVKIHKGPTFHGKKRFDEEFGWENSDVLSVLLQTHNKRPSKPSTTHFSAPLLVENKYFSCCHMENISSAETF